MRSHIYLLPIVCCTLSVVCSVNCGRMPEYVPEDAELLLLAPKTKNLSAALL